MPINSMIGNGLNPQYDLSLQGVTNHAMDLPLQQIETPQFDANKLLGVQPQITMPDTNIQLSDSAIKAMNKAGNKALLKSISGNIFGSTSLFNKDSIDNVKQMWKGLTNNEVPTFGSSVTNKPIQERNYFLSQDDTSKNAMYASRGAKINYINLFK